MKVHKVTKDRIFFAMDSGAYGSVSKTDVQKLVTALQLPEGNLDARTGACMVDNYVPAIPDDSVLISSIDYGELMTRAQYDDYHGKGFLEGTVYPSDGKVYWRVPLWEKEYSHVMYFSK